MSAPAPTPVPLEKTTAGPALAAVYHDAEEWAANDFAFAARYKATDALAPMWLTLYDVESAPPAGTIGLRTYTHLGTWTRTEARATAGSLPGTFILAVTFEIAPTQEADFNGWYEDEHMALVARVPGWLRGRRYKLVDVPPGPQAQAEVPPPPPPTYLAIHEVDNGDFGGCEALQYARSTEWAQRIIKSALKREVRTFELQEVSKRAV